MLHVSLFCRRLSSLRSFFLRFCSRKSHTLSFSCSPFLWANRATPFLASPPWSLRGATDPERLLLLPESCEHSPRGTPKSHYSSEAAQRWRELGGSWDSGSHQFLGPVSHLHGGVAVTTPAPRGRVHYWRPLLICESVLSFPGKGQDYFSLF